MLQQTLNELRLTLELQPRSPLLIKEGRHANALALEQLSGDVQGRKAKHESSFYHREVQRGGDTAIEEVDMTFVYSRTPNGDRYYLPGSSLRGILRTTAERSIGRWHPELVRDPFARQGPLSGTDRTLPDPVDSATIYRSALPIERCFGHTRLRGHWTIADAWLADEQQARPIVRHGVGIDRATGAAADKVKFTFEALSAGRFTTTLVLVNYELWQLGLLAHVLAALDGGAARIGYGTHRGLGCVAVRVTAMTWRWFLPRGQQLTIQDDRVSIPSMHALAHMAGIDRNYGWHDQELSLALALQRTTDLNPVLPLAQSWETPGLADGQPWLNAPWPSLGPLLPLGLEQWTNDLEAQA